MGSDVIVYVVVAIVVVAAIAFFFAQRSAHSAVDKLVRKHRENSIITHKAIFMEGRERIPVALSLMKDSIIYQNPDIDARLDLDRIDEVEYDDETSTGISKEGHSILRARSHGHVFEFMVTDDECKEWREHLHSHRMDEPGHIEAV